MAHIQTKTTNSQFHEKSQEFYELLFDVFHNISEKRVDIELDTVPDDEESIKRAYDAIEEAKTIIESMVKDDNSVGMDNLLRGLADKLEFACGNARAFTEEGSEEIELPQSPAKVMEQIVKPSLILRKNDYL